MKISIIGTGIYGIALALNIAENNHDIIMWSENNNLIKNYHENHNLKPLTDASIPTNIKVTPNLNDCFNSPDLIIMATSAKYVRSMAKQINNFYDKKTPICIASKGIENETCAFLSDILKEEIKTNYIGVLSGPTFAIDLINKDLCALSLSITNTSVSNVVIKALSNKHLKIRINYDLIGTQLVGSIKNIFAIASGILDGLGFSESTRAFLLTEATHDIKKLLLNMDCDPNTILSYAGIGDLILTSSSIKSRNYRYGLLLGKKSDPQTLTSYLENNTTEGYYTLLSIKELIKKRNINMPIINIIYDISVNKKDPYLLADFLINKD